MSNKSKMLVVDDDQRILDSLEFWLKRRGFEVKTADGGQEALNMLKEFSPDLIISDMRMPGMSGIEFMEKIPEGNGFFPGKIIFTAFDDDEALEVANLRGTGIFRVEKDRRTTDLLPAISRALDLQQLYRRTWDEGSKIAMVDQVQEDLEMGKRIQQKLLTNSSRVQQVFNEVGHNVVIFNQAPATVSGDFYFPKWINKNSIGLFFADTCGHGIAADMISMRILSVIDHLRSPIKFPSEFLDRLNEDISPLMPRGKFVAASYIIFHKDKISVSNAGQPYPLVVREDTTEEVEIKGFPLGQVKETEYLNITVPVSPGERVILYTDGLTEAANSEEELYGKERLINCARENAKLPIDELKNKIIEDVHNFIGDIPFDDDTTLIIVEQGGGDYDRGNTK